MEKYTTHLSQVIHYLTRGNHRSSRGDFPWHPQAISCFSQTHKISKEATKLLSRWKHTVVYRALLYLYKVIHNEYCIQSNVSLNFKIMTNTATLFHFFAKYTMTALDYLKHYNSFSFINLQRIGLHWIYWLDLKRKNIQFGTSIKKSKERESWSLCITMYNWSWCSEYTLSVTLMVYR